MGSDSPEKRPYVTARVRALSPVEKLAAPSTKTRPTLILAEDQREPITGARRCAASVDCDVGFGVCGVGLAVNLFYWVEAAEFIECGWSHL
jgi:hypothetical protein